MRLRSLFILIIVSAPLVSWAQTAAVTEDGQQVLLHDDGSLLL